MKNRATLSNSLRGLQRFVTSPSQLLDTFVYVVRSSYRVITMFNKPAENYGIFIMFLGNIISKYLSLTLVVLDKGMLLLGP